MRIFINSFQHFPIIQILIGCIFPTLLVFPADPVANSKSGISVTFDGIKGVDYAEEYFFHDPIISDKKVVYIRAETPIVMGHNELNVAGNPNRSDSYILSSTNVGTIRYKVDKDLNWGPSWAGGGLLNLPAYATPLTFSSLDYAPGFPVLGNTGPVPGVPLTPETKGAFYWRGMLDQFGDEWHVITVADDDSEQTSNREYMASDGKTVLFVVNPKTPCLAFRKLNTNSQFYTTPAKNYLVPKIHNQTTYITDDVDVDLDDLYGSNIVYRVNGGAWTTNQDPVTISHTTFGSGTNLLEFYSSSPLVVKSRQIIKNPSFPSSTEVHGNLLWVDNVGFSNIQSRITRNPYLFVFDKLRIDNFYNKQTDWDNERAGNRRVPVAALPNAFVARMLGNSAKWSAKTKTYAAYAKEMIIDNAQNIEPIGSEINTSGNPIPCREIVYRGYYDANTAFDMIFAYDLLIANYRSDQHPGGITPIEDHYIRDCLASFVSHSLKSSGGFIDPLFHTLDSGGMWDTARKTAAFCIAVGLTNYNSSYYGASGFHSNTNTYEWAPFQLPLYTWKNVLIDNNLPLLGYPNLNNRLGIEEYNISSEGHFKDRVPYYDFHLMGHCFAIVANVAKQHLNLSFPNLELSFLRAFEGSLMGLKDNSGPAQFNVITVINKNFPEVAERGLEWTKTLISSHPQSTAKKLPGASVYGIIWYDSDFDPASAKTSSPTVSPNGTSSTIPVNVTLSSPNTNASIYFTVDGSEPTTNSSVYTNPILINTSCVLKAVAKSGVLLPSSVVSAAFTIGFNTVAAPVIVPNGAILKSAGIASISTATLGAEIYYTLDGSDPSTNSQKYSGPIMISQTSLLKAVAVKEGMVDSLVQSALFTIVLNTPIIQPNGGVYLDPVTVNIQNLASGATIHYSLDGSRPTTNSPIFTAPFVLNSSRNVKALASRPGFTDSAVASQTYTVDRFLSLSEWSNLPISPISTNFVTTFDLVGSTNLIDAVTGFSQEEVGGYEDLAFAVRISPSGFFEALSNSVFSAESVFPYARNAIYNIRLQVDWVNKEYDAFVSHPGGSRALIADDYPFQQTEFPLTNINNLAFITLHEESHTVSRIRLNGALLTPLQNIQILPP